MVETLLNGRRIYRSGNFQSDGETNLRYRSSRLRAGEHVRTPLQSPRRDGDHVRNFETRLPHHRHATYRRGVGGGLRLVLRSRIHFEDYWKRERRLIFSTTCQHSTALLTVFHKFENGILFMFACLYIFAPCGGAVGSSLGS